MSTVPPYDPRREPPAVAPSEDEESDHGPPKSVRELLARVDDRSMEMHKALGGLTAEVSGTNRRLDSLEKKLDERVERLESKLRRNQATDAQIAADIKSIKEALRKEGKSVEDLKVELKDFTDDVEDSKRFVLQAKKAQKARLKVFWLVLGGAATAFGTFAAGALWSAVTHHAPPEPHPHVESVP